MRADALIFVYENKFEYYKFILVHKFRITLKNVLK